MAHANCKTESIAVPSENPVHITKYFLTELYSRGFFAAKDWNGQEEREKQKPGRRAKKRQGRQIRRPERKEGKEREPAGERETGYFQLPPAPPEPHHLIKQPTWLAAIQEG